MKLLVNPTTMRQDNYYPPPLGDLYLAAMVPETVVFDAAHLDQDPIKFIKVNRPEIVGVTMYTAGRKESLEILKAAKEVGAKTITGGPHVATMTKQLIEHYGDFVDHFVIGDGELAWKAICSGEELPQKVKMPVKDLDSLPLPKWDAVDIMSYPGRGDQIYRGVNLHVEPRISIVLGRGCQGQCEFCSTWWVNGKYRAHGKDWMAANLNILWNIGVRHLVFQDDCLTSNRQAALELCDILDQYGFVWFGTTRVDTIDLELAYRMKRCGCYHLAFGVESGSEEMLKKMNKKVNLDKAYEARMICAKTGIPFSALMMFGYPGETEQIRMKTGAFLRTLRPDVVGSIGKVWVFPGTVLYQKCKRAGLIDDDFWLGDEPYYVYEGGLDE
jgi:anaerobic magnesium-protoporphyrin IX monomethyl ester cyclase